MSRRGFIAGVIALRCTRSPLERNQHRPPEPPPPPPPPPPNPEILVGIIGTGQSLSVGAYGFPLVNPLTRYSNLKIDWDTSGTPWVSKHTFIPAGEPVRPAATGVPPYNCYAGHNSPLTAAQDQITACSLSRTGVGYLTVGEQAGTDGYTYELIKEGSPNFEHSIDYIQDAFNIASAPSEEFPDGRLYVVGAVLHTHGESDFGDNDYDDKLLEFADAYDTRIKVITGQTSRVMLIASQASAGYPAHVGGRPNAAWKTWRAAVDNPTKIVCAGPKYQYAYHTDKIHMVAGSYQRLGVKYGQVYDAIRSGAGWKPLQPVSASRVGTVITLTVDVPVGPLQFDESLTTEHVGAWANGRGFEVVDNSGPLTISSVTIASANTIAITLAATPGAGLTLSYAMELAAAGRIRKGQVCDSDPFIGFDSKLVNCTVTSGSTSVVPLSDLSHGPRDIAEHVSLPLGTFVEAWDGTTAILSQPWAGASGTASINFRSDQRNYLVQFEMAVT